MKSDTPTPPSLAGAIGMPCAWLSLTSGAMSLVVAMMIWWNSLAKDLTRLGQQVGLFSAAVGLALAGIAASSQRKRVRRVAVVAVVVNLFMLALTLDSMFAIVR